MFGNKNKNDLEELQRETAVLKEIAAEAATGGRKYEANRLEIVNSQRQMIANMNQVASNYVETRQLAEQNSHAEHELCEVLLEATGRAKNSQAQYELLKEQIGNQSSHCMELVDQNKHFTSPTKRVTEAVSGMLAQQRERMRQCDRMDDLMSQLNEQAVILADETQRMKAGAKYTAAVEQMDHRIADIRSELEQLRKKSEETAKETQELSEQVRYLVGLLKENNIAMGQLLKENQTTMRMTEKFQFAPDAKEVSEWRESLLGMHNVEDEILKLQERNRIQLEDIAEEVQAQNKAEKEIRDTLSPMFTKAREYNI